MLLLKLELLFTRTAPIKLGLTVTLHIWRRNALLSIAAGTGLYMYLAQTGSLL